MQKYALWAMYGILKSYIFFGHDQIKMMTRIDLILNSQRREWCGLKALFEGVQLAPPSLNLVKYSIIS